LKTLDATPKGLHQNYFEAVPEEVIIPNITKKAKQSTLGIIEDGGFETNEFHPVDMFPQTTLCEAVLK